MSQIDAMNPIDPSLSFILSTRTEAYMYFLSKLRENIARKDEILKFVIPSGNDENFEFQFTETYEGFRKKERNYDSGNDAEGE